MINEPMFLRHRDAVWPIFWPYFLWAIARFNRFVASLNARGMTFIDYKITPWGGIKITRTTFGPGWRYGLYTRAGAFDELAPLTPPLEHYRKPDPDIASLNVVFVHVNLLRTALKAWTQTYRPADRRLSTYLSAGLPLPHT
ncbi:MAG: hypothetical protein AAGJ32_05260 [Pseudomonadota bacterium]